MNIIFEIQVQNNCHVMDFILNNLPKLKQDIVLVTVRLCGLLDPWIDSLFQACFNGALKNFYFRFLFARLGLENWVHALSLDRKSTDFVL